MRPLSGEPVQVDIDKLRFHVKVLSLDNYPRNFQNTENLNAVADYISAEFRNEGGRVSEQKVPARGIEYRNVIAEFGPGSGPLIIVGAHYDADYDSRGADDNASGVAGLIELGHLIGQHGDELRYRVQLVAYTLEEPPFFGTPEMGSRMHARTLAESGETVRLMLSLEMIGYFSDDFGSQRYPIPLGGLLYPSQGNFIAVVGNLTNIRTVRSVKYSMSKVDGLPVYSLNAPSIFPGIDFSDHRNFWQSGFDAVMITDTAYFRNAAYHSQADTFDRLDYNKMSKVVESVFWVIRDQAQ